MGDYERRNNHRGGGGMGNRKRRYRDDDDYDRRPQRRRYEEPAHIKLRKRLLAIGESMFRDVGEEIEELGRLVCDEKIDPDVQSTFRGLLLQLVLEQPLKIPYLAAVLLMINSHDSSLTLEIIEVFTKAIETHVAEGAWREAKLGLRFLACCQGILEGEGVFPLLDELFSRAVDLQTASSEDGLGLELVKIILLTVTYTMASSATGFEERARALLEKTDIVASAPHVFEALVNPYTGDVPATSLIGLLSRQLQAEAGSGWPLECIVKPWKSGAASEGLEGKDKHILPTIRIPETVQPSTRPCLPEVYLSIYGQQDIETVPPTSNIASSIIRDSIVDTINILDFNRNAAAQALIDVDRYFTPNTMAKRATPFDKLKDLGEGNSTWKPEDVAVDAVFSQLLQLPFPPHKLVYYHSVLTEVCKLAPAAVAPSLGRAIRHLYKGLEAMDLELHYRFMDWFSHHLSNFGFTWKWTEWVDDVSLPLTHPNKSFVIGSLDKEIRLSFAQRIRGTLPEPLQVLVSAEKEKDTPDFKYDNDSEPYAPQAQETVRLIRSKASDADLEAQLTSIQDLALEQGVSDPIIPSTDVLVTCLCHIGSKSLSHFLSCVERTKDRLLSIPKSSEKASRQIVASVLSYWHARPGTAVNIVDKLLNYSILTPQVVIEYLFVDSLGGTEGLGRGEVLARPYVYELTSRVLSKVTHRLRQIVQARVSSAQQAALSDEQKAELVQTCDKEEAHVRRLFSIVDDALTAVAQGSNDAALEGTEQDAETAAALRAWGGKWLRVFRRKLAIETSYLLETIAAGVREDGGEGVSAEGLVKDGSGMAGGEASEMKDVASNGADTGPGEAQAMAGGENMEIAT